MKHKDISLFVDFLSPGEADYLKASRRTEYTEAVEIDKDTPGRSLALICSWEEGSEIEESFVQGVGIMDPLKRLNTLRRKREYLISGITWLNSPSRISIDHLISDLNRSQGNAILKSLSSRGGLPDKSEENFLGEILRKITEANKIVAEIRNTRSIDHIPKELRQQRSEERDAIATAFEIAGIDRILLSKLTPSADHSIVDDLGLTLRENPNNRARERDLLNVDMRNFDGCRGRDGITPNSVVIRHPEIGELTVVNVDGQPAETALGVDLIYYRHDIGSFVLVQYKRMKKYLDGWRYNEDQHLAGQLSKMSEFTSTQAINLDDPWNYRMEKSPFFLKTVRGEDYIPGHTDLMKGMYIPHPLVEQLRKTAQYSSDSGKLRIGFDASKNRTRETTFQPPYLSNTEFVTLFRGGWIGSSKTDSKRLLEKIQSQAAGGNSVIAVLQDRTRAPLRPNRNPPVGGRRR